MDDNRIAFSDIVDRCYKRVFQVAMGMLSERDQALDITQEVFLKAFKSYNSFNFNAAVETWLIRITINKVRDHLRRERVKRFLFLRSEDTKEKKMDMVANSRPSPHENLEGNKLKADIISFQKSLKGREREVFALRFGNEHTIKEISTLLGISQSSVKTHLYRALEKAKNHLSDWEKHEQ